MTTTKLGKIEKITVGYCGYQDAQFGVRVQLRIGNEVHQSDLAGCWAWTKVACDDNCKWTEADRSKSAAETLRSLEKIMSEAKVTTLASLTNKPVEAFFTEHGTVASWRILTEVL